MKWDCLDESICPIAKALAVVGDRWTLLLMRDLANKVNRFDELQASTGMSTHLLSVRLKRLEADGVIERRAYCQKPLRCEYHLTTKGEDLAPVLSQLKAWGNKWGDCSPGQDASRQISPKDCSAASATPDPHS